MVMMRTAATAVALVIRTAMAAVALLWERRHHCSSSHSQQRCCLSLSCRSVAVNLSLLLLLLLAVFRRCRADEPAPLLASGYSRCMGVSTWRAQM